MRINFSAKTANRRRRQLQARKNICMLTLSITAVVLLSVFIISISTQASGLESIEEYKYYKSVEVAKGDTLWSIAKEYIDEDHYKNIQEYVNEIKAMNSIKSDHIVAGSCLIVPYYSADYMHTEQ